MSEHNKIDIGKYSGKTIKSLSLFDNCFYVELGDGVRLQIYDSNHQCYEDRYMNCDDKLSDFIGAKLTGMSVRDGGVEFDDDDNVVECAFLHIETSEGDITVANYDVHNGYYGHFCISVEAEIPNRDTETVAAHVTHYER